MLRSFTILAAMALATPAFAQDHMDHGNQNHDHMAHDHKAHDMSGMTLAVADDAAVQDALVAGGRPIVVKVKGVVCDFCAVAMNKTFGKRDEIAASYVDLDAKTLTLVVTSGAEMDDKTVKKLVKKAGYKVAELSRPAVALNP